MGSVSGILIVRHGIPADLSFFVDRISLFKGFWNRMRHTLFSKVVYPNIYSACLAALIT